MNKLMREILYGMAYLQENQMVHADLRPSLISVPLIPSENFRLLDRLGNPAPPDQIQRNNIENRELLYASPAIFKSILKGKKRVRHNPFKSDTFSLGMILLQAGILESVQGVYNHPAKDIDEGVLVELVEKFIDQYPDDYVLQEGLMIMLEFSEKLRQTPAQLLNTLRELKENEIEEGRAEVSFINFENDPMMNKLQFTESGYEYREADHMLISNFSRIQSNKKQMSLMKSEEIQDDMEKSLVNRIKEKQSKFFENDLPAPVRSSNLKKMKNEEKEKEKEKEEKEILDSFMKNEERAKMEQVQVEHEINRIKEKFKQKELDKKEEVRGTLNVKMEKNVKPENSTLNLYNKIVADEEMFQSFKKVSNEPEEGTFQVNGENPKKEVSLGTKKEVPGKKEDNVFNIEEYLQFYGVKEEEKKPQKKEDPPQVKNVEIPDAFIHESKPTPENIFEKEKPIEKVEIRMNNNEVEMKTESPPVQKKSENSDESKKESVYDYFASEQFEGLAS